MIPTITRFIVKPCMVEQELHDLISLLPLLIVLAMHQVRFQAKTRRARYQNTPDLKDGAFYTFFQTAI